METVSFAIESRAIGESRSLSMALVHLEGQHQQLSEQEHNFLQAPQAARFDVLGFGH